MLDVGSVLPVIQADRFLVIGMIAEHTDRGGGATAAALLRLRDQPPGGVRAEIILPFQTTIP